MLRLPEARAALRYASTVSGSNTSSGFAPLTPAGSLLRFTAEEFAAIGTIMVLTPRASPSRGGVSTDEEFTASTQTACCKLMSMQDERSTVTPATPRSPITAEPEAARIRRGWVWAILAGASVVGVVNVIVIALVG